MNRRQIFSTGGGRGCNRSLSKMIIQLLLLSQLSILCCHAFNTIIPLTTSSTRSLIHHCRIHSSSASTTALQMAQRMTPTRKTRKEDSFDRGEDDDKEKELDGE